MRKNCDEKVGLVLTGGGARSAYHAGVLLGLSRLLGERNLEPIRFPIISGISGGAINGGFLASKLADTPAAIDELAANWETISLEDVIETASTKMVGTAMHMLMQLGLGGLFNAHPVTELLNTIPLISYLNSKIDFTGIRENIRAGRLLGLGMTATNYGTGSSVTFFEGLRSIEPWMRSHRIGIRARLCLKHILASAAIPILFPPVKLNGSYYGDGAIRMSSPLSPAIHMGADRIIAIGVRYYRTPVETLEINRTFRMDSVQLADISGVLLNSLFMDALDSDLERMLRINHTLERLRILGESEQDKDLRSIPVLAFRPSIDLGKLAINEFRQFSPILRHFIRGLGASEDHGADLLSYLAFEKSYTSRLIKLGIKDVKNDAGRIIDWLEKS